MVRITPVEPITLSEEWKPWSAQSYNEVKLKGTFWDGWGISLVVILGFVPLLLLVSILVAGVCTIGKYLWSAAGKRCGRRKNFSRFEEEGTPKARASPPSRTTEMV